MPDEPSKPAPQQCTVSALVMGCQPQIQAYMTHEALARQLAFRHGCAPPGDVRVPNVYYALATFLCYRLLTVEQATELLDLTQAGRQCRLCALNEAIQCELAASGRRQLIQAAAAAYCPKPHDGT